MSIVTLSMCFQLYKKIAGNGITAKFSLLIFVPVSPAVIFNKGLFSNSRAYSRSICQKNATLLQTAALHLLCTLWSMQFQLCSNFNMYNTIIHNFIDAITHLLDTNTPAYLLLHAGITIVEFHIKI